MGSYLMLVLLLCGRFNFSHSLIVRDVYSSFTKSSFVLPRYVVALASKGKTVQPMAHPTDLDDDMESPIMGSTGTTTMFSQITLSAGDGLKYCCTVITGNEMVLRPSPGHRTGPSLVIREEGLRDFSPSVEKTPLELLDAMSALCLYRQEGLWTYELCYKKYVRQFRQAKSGHIEDFSCGVFTSAGGQDESVKEDISSHPYPIRYVSHTFVGGAECAMTGEPRTAEVRFTCMPGINDNVIVSMNEFPTCNYVFVINAPLLCTLTDFSPPMEQEILLSCEPALNGCLNAEHAQHHPADKIRRW
ncbi:hypothetical protein VaNZ11_005638 [Volvox africanus]|uniref:MRH domain-containing protein n=1 Tax=Volvox africanus TaxID=51714 RepID=A0ABQ5RZP9_9CHLO|nr:hypothetical protein VaNZ11_005638 [Volvox africanus]